MPERTRGRRAASRRSCSQRLRTLARVTGPRQSGCPAVSARPLKPADFLAQSLLSISSLTRANSLLAERVQMARKTIFVSDLSGEQIDEKNSATLTIRYADARRGQVILDVNASEVDELASKGRKQARRGRRPKAEA